MNWDVLHVVALLNFALCSAAGAICLCRLVKMGPNTSAGFIGRYALLFTAATSSGFQPLLFGEWPGAADVLMSATLVLFLSSSRRAWRSGTPAYALKPVRDEYLPSTVGGKR